MIGGPIGGLIGAAVGAAAGFMAGSSGPLEVDDFRSDGSHLVLTPKGKLLETNENDTVFATTSPEKMNSDGGSSSPSINTAKMEFQLAEQNKNLLKLLNVVGTTFGFGGSLAKSFGSEVGRALDENS